MNLLRTAFQACSSTKSAGQQLGKFDEDGIAKPGQVLNPGDPIILATRPRVVSSGSAQLGQLSKHMRNARTPAEVLWDQPTPGQVTDVARVKGGVKVNVTTQKPLEVGDKRQVLLPEIEPSNGSKKARSRWN